MALIHYDRLPGKTASAATSARTSSPPLNHWKRKAKDRKREILRLREELKLLQDGARGEEMEPPVASCRCHFFDGGGDLPTEPGGSGGEHWVDEVLRRRFLRLVRWKEKRRRVDRSLPRSNFIDFNSEDEMQQLSMSTDYLVELSDGIFTKREAGSSIATFSHQAVKLELDFTDKEHVARNLSRQQSQQQAWLQKRRQENMARKAAGEEPLPEEDPSNPILKPIPEPSRLEGYLVTNQISNYCNHINGLVISMWMFMLVAVGEGIAVVLQSMRH